MGYKSVDRVVVKPKVEGDEGLNGNGREQVLTSQSTVLGGDMGQFDGGRDVLYYP